MHYDKHVFICINERIDSARSSCGEHTGKELIAAFKKALAGKGMNIRINKSGCLDCCDFGPTVIVYPEGVFYGSVTLGDVDEIVQDHLIDNKPVERLFIKFPKRKEVE